jgi:serine/threonine-protein kinase
MAVDVIDPERWQVLRRHLDVVLDLEEPERATWLATLTETDPALASELHALLDEHRQLATEGFLEGAAPTPAPASIEGQTVGAYTLRSLIGRGGMGGVWLADRSDGRFERRVAVKFLNVALAGRGEERFRREGTLLARLAHPHIARLLDAGVTGTGQPFLILEYVDGEPIDRYCDTHRLTVDAKIRLFLDVLAAVAHAHVNLIVHRDIKPSNVLVDRSGQVKLLDFGIAKLLEADSSLAMATMLTRDEGVGLTPEFAAPEQLTDAPITTATDVYALGVLLYVLLSRRHPIASEHRSTADLIKGIVDRDAPLMSSVAPDTVRRQLRGDLDAIVAKAIQRDPAARYQSVTALATDLTQYLEHLPVSARRELLHYRAGKFVRRHVGPVAVTALVIAALTAGLVVVNRERALAERRFDQLRSLSNNVIALDRQIRDLPGSIEARQGLVSASLRYLEGLAADADRNNDLALEVGEAYWRIARIQGVPTELNLGDFAQAESSLKKADALIQRVLASRPNSRAAVWDSATIAHDRMILAQSEHRNDEARRFAQQAAEQMDAFMRHGDVSLAERDQVTAQYGNIALAYTNMRMYAQAEPYARRAVDVGKTIPSTPRLDAGLSVLANVLRFKGDIDGAVMAIEEAQRAAQNATYANETLRMFELYGVWLRAGQIYGDAEGINAGRFDDAIAALQRAVDLTEEAARNDPRDYASRSREASSARDLGKILMGRDPARALAVYDLGLRRLSELRSNLTTQRDRAVLLANSSYPLRALSRETEATARIAAARAILSQTHDYPAATATLDSEVFILMRAEANDVAAQGRFDDAVRSYEQLLKAVMAAPGDPTEDLRLVPRLSTLYGTLADLYRRTGRSADADALSAKRRALWLAWQTRLPGNAYIARQLDDAR